MRVIGKRILVKQTLTKEVSKGGIVLTGDQQPLPYGEVIQVSVGMREVAVGDIVLFTEIASIPLGIKKHYVLIEFEDVLAILNKEDIENVGT